jgi:hypothetical protein
MSHGRMALRVVAVASALGACVALGDPETPVGAIMTDGRPTLLVSLCQGEGVRSVFITDSSDQDGDGPLLWRIDAIDHPVIDETLVVGDTPEGFSQTRSLDPRALRREVTAWILTDSIELVGAVDFTDMDASRVYVDLKPTSRQSFEESRDC